MILGIHMYRPQNILFSLTYLFILEHISLGQKVTKPFSALCIMVFIYTRTHIIRSKSDKTIVCFVYNGEVTYMTWQFVEFLWAQNYQQML